MGGNESRYVQEAFDTNWVAPLGPNVNGFEEDIAAFLGGKVHVAALSSGTAALHLGLIMLGVGVGDEVICQSFTFSATANPIAYLGATPVFVDSEPDTWNMCPRLLKKAIRDRLEKGKKPKAIIPVHLYGMPAKMDEIMAIAAEYEIPVLEDAAEALGSHINGKMCGTFASLAALSFNGNKIITTSGGGALVTAIAEQAAEARFLSTQARDQAPHYQHSHIGYNYRMSNISAGIGRGQMEVLNRRILQRKAVHNWYRKLLKDAPGIRFHDEPDGYSSNRWLTTVLIDPEESQGLSRELLRLAFDKENIESRPLWKPMHQQPVFSGCPYYGDGLSDYLFEYGLCLPSGSNMTDEEQFRIRAVLEDCRCTVQV